MQNLVAGIIFEVVVFGFLMNLMILSGCSKKKKQPVEDGHSQLNEPHVIPQPAAPPKMAKRKPPDVEHTVSIKMQNNADDEMEVPQVSSNQPISDVPKKTANPKAATNEAKPPPKPSKKPSVPGAPKSKTRSQMKTQQTMGCEEDSTQEESKSILKTGREKDKSKRAVELTQTVTQAPETD